MNARDGVKHDNLPVYQQEGFRGHQIQVVDGGSQLELRIDGKLLPTAAEPNGELFSTSFCPYSTYRDLISLGKAVIRSGNWTGVDHGVNS